MPNWKALVNRSSSSKHSQHSRKSQQKYHPQKYSVQDDSNKNMFHNRTIQKIQRSLIDSQVIRSQSASRSSLQGRNYSSKKLHPSASQQRLRKDPTIEVTYPKIQSQNELGNSIKIYTKLKNSPSKDQQSKSNQNNQLFVEVYKLKSDFKAFQQKIMKELKKQQNMLTSMFEQVLKNLKTHLNDAKVGGLQIQNRVEVVPCLDTQLLQRLKKEETGEQMKIQQNHIQTGVSADNIQTVCMDIKPIKQAKKQLDDELFLKFFEAMNSLKRDMEQIKKLNYGANLSQHSLPPKNNGSEYFPRNGNLEKQSI